jgi:hypothetical protein
MADRLEGKGEYLGMKLPKGVIEGAKVSQERIDVDEEEESDKSDEGSVSRGKRRRLNPITYMSPQRSIRRDRN